MVVYSLLLLIGILLLVIVMQSGFIRRCTSRFSGGDYYPPYRGGGGSDSLFIVFIIIAMIGIVALMGKKDLGKFFRELDVKVMRGDLSDQVDRRPDGLAPSTASVIEVRDQNADLADFGSEVTSNTEVVVEDIPSDMPPTTFWGFQYKCGEVAKFAHGEAAKLKGSYPDVQVLEVAGNSPFKVVLFTAGTRREVEDWRKANPQLGKGFVRHFGA